MTSTLLNLSSHLYPFFSYLRVLHWAIPLWVHCPLRCSVEPFSIVHFESIFKWAFPFFLKFFPYLLSQALNTTELYPVATEILELRALTSIVFLFIYDRAWILRRCFTQIPISSLQLVICLPSTQRSVRGTTLSSCCAHDAVYPLHYLPIVQFNVCISINNHNQLIVVRSRRFCLLSYVHPPGRRFAVVIVISQPIRRNNIYLFFMTCFFPFTGNRIETCCLLYTNYNEKK